MTNELTEQLKYVANKMTRKTTISSAERDGFILWQDSLIMSLEEMKDELLMECKDESFIVEIEAIESFEDASRNVHFAGDSDFKEMLETALYLDRMLK